MTYNSTGSSESVSKMWLWNGNNQDCAVYLLGPESLHSIGSHLGSNLATPPTNHVSLLYML